MRPAITLSLALSLAAGAALAQTSSTPSTSGGTSTTGTIARGAPALVPKPTGPITPSRSTAEIYAPSRLLPATQGTAVQTNTPSTQTPGGSTQTPGTSTTTPDANSTSTNPDGRATGDGSSQTAGQQKGQVQPNAQTSSGSGGVVQTRTGKNQLNDTVADCMNIWEPATHMTKAEWSRTCRRVQSRLNQVTQ